MKERGFWEFEISLRGTKGLSKKPWCIGTGRARIHFYCILSFHLRLGLPSPNRSFFWRSSCMVFCPFHSSFLLTPWSRVVLEKLTGFQLVEKFPALYKIRRFINAFTSARQLSLSWATSIQFILIHPTFWRCIWILSSHLRLGLPKSINYMTQKCGVWNIEHKLRLSFVESKKNNMKINFLEQIAYKGFIVAQLLKI